MSTESATPPQFPACPTITDPRFDKKERLPFYDRLALRFIRDERDLPFIHLALQMTFIQLPFAIALFVPGVFRWWLAVAYLAMAFLVFIDRYILMLHNTSHRPLFKKGYQWVYPWFVWVLGPLAGETPETYFAHHIGMHHAEGNLEQDLSSTMRFQRDKLSHFLQYWSRFFFGVVFELSAYFRKRDQPKMVRRMLSGELTWYAVTGLLLWVNWQAALTVLVIPFFMVRFLMMAGNWAQHAFVDPADPADPVKSAITCVNCRYNRRCYNDGYHIGHHEMAARHWTDLPGDFENKRTKYREHDGVIFEGIDFFQIWALLMLKQYGTLAKHFVDLREEPRSREEIIALLKDRVKPVVRDLAVAPAPAE